jgi:Na+/proline symporter
MSLSTGLIAAVALAYMAIMFAIAFYGDRRSAPLPPRMRAWVYSLSLAVYCTSWTFFGAVGQAAEQLWSFLPIYLGPILLLVGAPWVLQKMVMISKQENITSIADFIAARYGKSQSLAVVVALICLVGVLPYIALQLKGIVLGVNLLIGAGADAMGTRAQDTALIVSLVLALFTIVFRYAQPRCHRAPPWHGVGDCLRIAGQTVRLSRRRRLRHLWPVRRFR